MIDINIKIAAMHIKKKCHDKNKRVRFYFNFFFLKKKNESYKKNKKKVSL